MVEECLTEMQEVGSIPEAEQMFANVVVENRVIH